MTNTPRQPSPDRGNKPDRDAQPAADTNRRPWRRPEVEDLPPLQDLTLQTPGDPVGGGEGIF